MWKCGRVYEGERCDDSVLISQHATQMNSSTPYWEGMPCRGPRQSLCITAAVRPSCHRSHFSTLTCSNTPAAFLTVVVKGANDGSFPRSCSGWCISPSVHDSASCSTRNSEGLLAISLNEPGSCVVVGARGDVWVLHGGGGKGGVF